jgi:hypothetical protein
MYRSRYIEEGNWNGPIRTKAEDGCDVVIMHPSVIKCFLDVCVSS